MINNYLGVMGLAKMPVYYIKFQQNHSTSNYWEWTPCQKLVCNCLLLQYCVCTWRVLASRGSVTVVDGRCSRTTAASVYGFHNGVCIEHANLNGKLSNAASARQNGCTWKWRFSICAKHGWDRDGILTAIHCFKNPAVHAYVSLVTMVTVYSSLVRCV